MGRIKSVKMNRCMEPVVERGYYRLSLWLNDKPKKFHIHRLVALHFVDNPDNKKRVYHINGDRLDNRCDNLKWVRSFHNPDL